MEEKIARCRRRRMDRPLDWRKWFQFPGTAVKMKTIPERAADSDNAREPRGQIAKSDRFDEIVEPIERGADLCESGLFASDRDHKKNG